MELEDSAKDLDLGVSCDSLKGIARITFWSSTAVHLGMVTVETECGSDETWSVISGIQGEIDIPWWCRCVSALVCEAVCLRSARS